MHQSKYGTAALVWHALVLEPAFTFACKGHTHSVPLLPSSTYFPFLIIEIKDVQSTCRMECKTKNKPSSLKIPVSRECSLGFLAGVSCQPFPYVSTILGMKPSALAT